MSEYFKEKDIVMTGYAGLYGSVMLARTCHERISGRLPGHIIDRLYAAAGSASARTSDEAGTEASARTSSAADLDASFAADTEAAEKVAKSYRDSFLRAGEGGIYRALWDIAEMEKTGIEVYLPDINIRQETIEICECLDVNPYMLNSKGCLVIISEKGNMLIRALREKGIEASIAGHTCAGNDKAVINGDIRSYIQPRMADEIHRFSL